MPRILPIAPEHIAGFREALGAVARERAYLAHLDTPALEWATAFVTNNIARDHAQFVAVEGDAVVGWCDILPNARPGFGHCGSVGMGVLRAWRGQGLGRALLEACLEKAFARGLTRIELEVYADNALAIALYRKLGFVEEGLKRRARVLDGRAQDLRVMALLREPRRSNPGSEARTPLTRFAMIIRGPGYTPEVHRHRLDSGAFSTTVVCVASFEQALPVARELADGGIQLIELCGGFSPEQAAALGRHLGGRVPVGAVRYSEEEQRRLEGLFGFESPEGAE